MYIDTHAHILSQYYTDDEIASIAEQAELAGMKAVINTGLDPATNREVLRLHKNYPILKPALGYYPLEAIKEGADIAKEIAFIKSQKNKILAVSEVGLDYAYSKEKDAQKKVFIQFIELAKELDKPLIIHSRKAEEDCLRLCAKSGHKKIVFHTFTGNFKLVKEIEAHRWFFSVPTALMYATHFQELIKRVSLAQVFTETDCPYMAPDKSEKNMPHNVVQSVQKIAELKGMDVEEVKRNIFMNYQQVFL